MFGVNTFDVSGNIDIVGKELANISQILGAKVLTMANCNITKEQLEDIVAKFTTDKKVIKL